MKRGEGGGTDLVCCSVQQAALLVCQDELLIGIHCWPYWSQTGQGKGGAGLRVSSCNLADVL